LTATLAKRALIVANQQYEDARFAELPGAAADARELASVLGSRIMCEFDVEVVAEAGTRTIKRQIAEFFTTAGRDDLLLLHLSCHGRRDDRNQLYFVSKDTDHQYLAATSVDAAFVNDQVEQSRSRRVVLLLDCCYSGMYVKGIRTTRGDGLRSVPVNSHFSGTGMAVITACSALQFAYDGDHSSSLQRGQPSAFTSAVVDGLRTGAGDVDGDGLVSVNDLFTYVHDQVSLKVPGQTPEFSVNRLRGALFLARTPASIAFGGALTPLPPAVHNAVVQGEPWQRFGATMALERLLDSDDPAERLSAREALIPLARDSDDDVRARARSIWTAKVKSMAPIVIGTSSAPAVRPVREFGGRAVGIDFGTTNSSVAVLDGDGALVVRNRFGSTITPSVVGFSAKGDVLVGEAAKRQAVLAPDYTVQSIKRRLGSDWHMTVAGHTYSAEMVTALILERLRLDAEAYLNEPVRSAVITVPTGFTMAQRGSLRRAAAAAGMTSTRLVNEPSAASSAYGLTQTKEEQTILVFDLGGGTLDVSLLELGEGVIEEKATSGDNNLGGDDWDRALVDYLVRHCAQENRLDLSEDKAALQRLREAAENAKVELSEATEVTINLPYLGQVDGRPVHLRRTLARTEFEQLTASLVKRCRRPIEDVLRAADIAASDVDHVVLVGGSTRLPAIAEMVRELLGGKVPSSDVHPDEAIAVGAALRAGTLIGVFNAVLTLDVVSTSLGLQTLGGVFTAMIDRNSTIPVKRSDVFTTAEDNQSSVLIQIFEGEQPMAQDNCPLAVLELAELPPSPRGIPQIKVTFDVDATGILHVSAQDLDSRRHVKVTVSGDSPHGTALVSRMDLALPAGPDTT
jgi:molecular chaperone DnaK